MTTTCDNCHGSGLDTTDHGFECQPAEVHACGYCAPPFVHDEACESEFIFGPMAWSPCGCEHRAAEREAA